MAQWTHIQQTRRKINRQNILIPLLRDSQWCGTHKWVAMLTCLKDRRKKHGSIVDSFHLNGESRLVRTPNKSSQALTWEAMLCPLKPLVSSLAALTRSPSDTRVLQKGERSWNERFKWTEIFSICQFMSSQPNKAGVDLLSFSSFTVWIGLILILLSSRTMEASLDKCLEKCRLKQRVCKHATMLLIMYLTINLSYCLTKSRYRCSSSNSYD